MYLPMSEELPASPSFYTAIALVIASEELAKMTGAHPSDIRTHMIELGRQRYADFLAELRQSDRRRAS